MSDKLHIAPFSIESLGRILALWNSDNHRHPCSHATLFEKIFEDPGVQPETCLTASIEEKVVGFCVGALRAESLRGHIKCIAVDPNCRRQGIGSALLSDVEQALAAHTIGALRVHEAAPNYLTPGLSQQNPTGRRFFEAHGYDLIGQSLNMTVELNPQNDLEPSQWTTDEQEELLAKRNFEIRRATTDDKPSLDNLLSGRWDAWKHELQRTMQNDPISLHLALRDSQVVGFSAYDANNRGTGWFGPMGTDPAVTGQGIGRALLWRCLSDIESQGHKLATIPWVGPVGFYERHCGAQVSEKFWRLEKRV